MRQKTLLFIFGLWISIGFVYSKTDSKVSQKQLINDSNLICVDSTISLLKRNETLSINSIQQLKIIDSNYFYSSKGEVFCEKTVQLNEEIFYSIISISDTLGLCSNLFVLSLNEKHKKPIAYKYLGSSCDIDFSRDNYTVYEYSIIFVDKIRVRVSIIYQKKRKRFNNETDNIKRTEIKDHFFLINQLGEIVLSTN